MKRILLTLTLLTLLFSGAQAQDTHPFRIGLKVDPSLGWLSPETSGLVRDGMSLKFGYGLHAEFWFTNRYAFTTGVLINGAGGALNFPSGQDSIHYYLEGDKLYLVNRNYLLNYVTVPLTLKLKTNEIGYMTYFGQFGMDVSVRTKAWANDEVILSGSSSILTKDKVNIDNDISLLRMGLNVGIGTEYMLSGTTSILFGISYHNGFTNTLRHKSNMLINPDGSQFLQKAMNHQVSLTVGVIF